MQPNWDYVKKTTLWQFEDLIKKLGKVKGYPCIWQAYNHDMTRASVFARTLFPDKNIEAGEFPAPIIASIEHLKLAQITDWEDLLSKNSSRAACLDFITRYNFKFEEFIDLLNYLLRWGFPFETASRELLDHQNAQEMSMYGSLKRHNLMNSFDLLEHGRTLHGRRALASLTGLPIDFMTALIHRADIARLPYVRRKTILPVTGAGYSTLAKIAAADMAQMEADLDDYFKRTQGKPLQNYRAVIVVKILVTCARALPVLMEE